MSTRTEQLIEDLPITAMVGLREAEEQSKPRDSRDPETARNEEQRELLVDVREVFDQVAQQGGVVPASLLNMHPWPVRSTGPHNEGIVIPACPIGQEWTHFVQRDFRRDFGDRWGRFKVRPIWPIMIMRDFQRQHEQWGGIVTYMGDHTPGEVANAKTAGVLSALRVLFSKAKEEADKKLIQEVMDAQKKDKDERFETVAQLKGLVEAARAAQIQYYEKRYEMCEQADAADAKMAWRQITPNDRQIARWLIANGRYAKAPRWLSEKRPANFTQTSCAKCGKDIDPTKGYACSHCNYIYHGLRALETGEIKRDHVSLQRHTRAELDAAGLHGIATLAEMRAVEDDDENKKKGKSTKASEPVKGS